MKIEKPRWVPSPIWPALLSALVAPGVGQIANREIPKGILLLVASIGSFIWFSRVVTERLAMLLPGSPDTWIKDQSILRDAITKLVTQNPEMFLTFQLLILLVWGFGVVDAYLSARKRFRIAGTPTNEGQDTDR